MIVVSSKEFISNEGKYFDLALDEDVGIKRGDYTFYLVNRPVENQYPPQPFLEPDEDLRRAITAEELKKRMSVSIRNFFENKQ